jgi:hypothetical protein
MEAIHRAGSRATLALLIQGCAPELSDTALHTAPLEARQAEDTGLDETAEAAAFEAEGPLRDSSALMRQGGFLQVTLPSIAGDKTGIAVRIFHPSAGASRYAAGAPIVVEIPGGHGPGDLSAGDGHPELQQDGVIALQYLLPGGRSEDGAVSGGAYDYRGPNCQRATADVLAYAMGQLADTEGMRIDDRLPFALTDNVGVLGISNGGNLALTTLRAHHEDLTALAWLGISESPIGDQYVLADLGPNGALNPLYEPGTCTIDACPLPGLAALLDFDPDHLFDFEDPASDVRVELAGRFFLDDDGDGSLDQDEFSFVGLFGPGERPRWYPSDDLRAIIESKQDLFDGGFPPPWLASAEESAEFWSDRDGSTAIAAVSQALPELPVMMLATLVDHVQGQPDHPHIRTVLQTFLAEGLEWIRLNPDAAYLAELSGKPAELFPDNAAMLEAPWPGIEDWLLPEERFGVFNLHTRALILEMADRVQADDWSDNLDEPVTDPRPPPVAAGR